MSKYACRDCDTTFTAPTDTDTVRCPGCGDMVEQQPAVSSPPPDQTAVERSERYATAIHDAMETDLSLVDQEPGMQALFARAAEAAMALADAEQTVPPLAEDVTVSVSEKRARLFGFIEVGAEESDLPSFAAAIDDYVNAVTAPIERIRENADFHLGQEMARRQLAEKEADRLSADRGAVLNAAADAVFALNYDDLVSEQDDENLGSMREAWDLGTIHATQLLRRLAAEAQQSEPGPVARVRALHQPDGNGECQHCHHSAPCPTITALDGAEAQQQPDTETPTEDPARIDRLRPEFTDHASVEAIDAQLHRARAQERRWHIRVEWLIGLRAARVEQKARGEWPAVRVGAAAADTSEETRRG